MDIAFRNFMSSGHCFWEKTSNGCKDDDDTFTHDAYDFYELCRAGERKGAEFHCEQAPAKLRETRCKYHYKADYYYMDPTTEQQFCFDCQQSRCMCRGFGCRGIFQRVLKGRRAILPRVMLAEGYSLRMKNAVCSSRDTDLAP